MAKKPIGKALNEEEVAPKKQLRMQVLAPVSYTHLTLPTMLMV